MKNEILEELHDPYDLKKNGPAAFEYLQKADSYVQGIFHRSRMAEYYKNSDFLKNALNRDYQMSYPLSVPLSFEEVEFNDSLSEALFNRQSIKEFFPKKLAFENLSFLLLLAAGLKDKSDKNSQRMFPSGGGLYTTRLYIDARNVENLTPGVYLFNPYRETLDLINDEITNKNRFDLQNGAEKIESIESSVAQLLVTIKPQLAFYKYGELALKLSLIEMGHMIQNIALIAAGLGLAGCPSCTLNLKHSEDFLRTDAQGEFLAYSYIFGFSK